MFYLINSNSEITAKVESAPTDGHEYVIYSMELDLDNYIYVVGSVDSNHNVTWMNPRKPKTIEQLIANLKVTNQTNDILGQQVSDLTLQNMQLNSIVDALGTISSQSQLDIMTLKGGVSYRQFHGW